MLKGPVMEALSEKAIRELSPGLIAYAYRRVGQRQDAEDLVQETWYSALRSMPTFEGRSSLRTWLVTILSRRIAERYRRRRTYEPFEEEAHATLTSLPTENEIEKLDLELAAQVASSAFGSLSEVEQRAIELCDVNDEDRDRVAEDMGVTRGHLRVLLHRGRHKLEAALRAQGIAA